MKRKTKEEQFKEILKKYTKAYESLYVEPFPYKTVFDKPQSEDTIGVMIIVFGQALALLEENKIKSDKEIKKILEELPKPVRIFPRRKTKEELIEEYLEMPTKVGDSVVVRGLGSQDKKNWGSSTEVVAIYPDGSVGIKEYGYSSLTKIAVGDYKKNTFEVGYNPINQKPYNSTIRSIAFSLDSIMHAIGFERRINSIDVEELNWNPYVIDSEGNEIVYQRPLVWDLEDKQFLIESIYNKIDIGKIIIRKRPYEYVVQRGKEGKPAFFKDIVDGKQRLHTILEFCTNEFADLDGFYWKDFSEKAKRQFMDFNGVSYGEMGEKATDVDVKEVFLAVNFTGVQMSQKHVDFVKNLKL